MFEVIAEIEPPVTVDLSAMREQVAALRPVTSRFLVPDDHTGRATVSSIVVADRVGRFGARATACLNARDRNLLGLRRDLLTAQHLGVDELLLVYGDEPSVGERAGGMRVRTMVEECLAAGLRFGVTTRLSRLPAWKLDADRLFVQVSWSIDRLLRWRDATAFAGAVYAGVMVLPSAATARRIGAQLPELQAPDALLDALDRDRDAGVRHAVELIEAVRASGAFDRVHLIAGRRFAQTAACLATGMTLERSA
ncbi:MAG: methylenetetrahydrofolate reductase [Ilumatobacteraceae bacterium]